MKELAATAMNRVIIEDGEGGIKAHAEIVIVATEPTYRLGNDRNLLRERVASEFRFMCSEKGLRDTAASLIEWADELAAAEARIVAGKA
jgi:hypothetical protein